MEPEKPEQHQVFYSHGRRQTTPLAGRDYDESTHPGEPTLNARVREGDPLPRNGAASRGRPVLIEGISISFSTRRRNEFAGYIHRDPVPWKATDQYSAYGSVVKANDWVRAPEPLMIEIVQSTTSCRSRTHTLASYTDASTCPPTNDCPMMSCRSLGTYYV